MADRKRIIEEWESILSRDPLDVPWDLIDETLTLLKEQEAVKPFEDYDGHYVWRCGNCRAPIFHSYNEESVEGAKTYAKFCRQCGKPVKWDDETDF